MMKKCSVMLCSLGLLACTGRAAPHSDAVSTDAVRSDSNAAFCAGGAKMSINGALLTVKDVQSVTFMPQCCREAAEVRLVTSGVDGGDWEVHVTFKVGVTQTITNKPLPQTVQLAEPPPGFAADAFFRRPAGCVTSCFTDLLNTEFDRFSGWLTIRGKDYDSPDRLEICLFATDEGATHPPDHAVHSLRIYAPNVTIPRWRVGP